MSALKITQINDRGFVTPETALLAVGIALFAFGVAVKVWQHKHDDQRYRPRKKQAHL